MSKFGSPTYTVSVMNPISGTAPGRTSSRWRRMYDVVGQLLAGRALRDPAVAARRDASERGLAVAAHPDRRTRVLHRPRPLTDVLEAPVVPTVLGPFVGERGGDRVDRFVRARAALLERNAEHLELTFDVTHTDTDDRAAARERVERREGLGRL